MSIHPSTHHWVSIYHVPVTVWELSIQKWTRKVISLLSWSLNFTHPPSIQYSYTESHSTWKIWAALGTKVFFLICWTDHNTLKTCDGSLSSCKQLIALDSLAPQTQPDHLLQVFTCSHSSAIPPLPFLFPFNFSLSFSSKPPIPSLTLGYQYTLRAWCCFSEAWWERELPGLAWSQDQTKGPLQPSQSLCQAGPPPPDGTLSLDTRAPYRVLVSCSNQAHSFFSAPLLLYLPG